MIIIPTKQDLNKNHNDSPKGDKNNRHVIPMKLQGVIRNPFAFLLAVGRAFSGTVGTLPIDCANQPYFCHSAPVHQYVLPSSMALQVYPAASVHCLSMVGSTATGC